MDSFSPVDDHSNCVTTCYLGSIDWWKTPKSVPRTTSKSTSSLSRVWILVYGNYFLILQNFKWFLACCCDIAANNQRSFGHSPHCKMRFLFFMCQSSISNFKHVGVIPTSWTRSLKVSLTFKEIILNGGPIIVNILCGPPWVSNFWCPSPGIFFSPIAKWEKDWSSCSK